MRVRVRRQLLQRALDGAGEPRLGCGQGGAAEVDHGAEGLGRQGFEAARGQRVARGDGGPAARAPARLQEALGAQGLVRRGHGGTADGQGHGQLALGGEPRGDRHTPFEHQQPYAVGEGAVRRRLARAGPLRARLLGVELPGELGRTDRRSPLRHNFQST